MAAEATGCSSDKLWGQGAAAVADVWNSLPFPGAWPTGWEWSQRTLVVADAVAARPCVSLEQPWHQHAPFNSVQSAQGMHVAATQVFGYTVFQAHCCLLMRVLVDGQETSWQQLC